MADQYLTLDVLSKTVVDLVEQLVNQLAIEANSDIEALRRGVDGRDEQIRQLRAEVQRLRGENYPQLTPR